MNTGQTNWLVWIVALFIVYWFVLWLICYLVFHPFNLLLSPAFFCDSFYLWSFHSTRWHLLEHPPPHWCHFDVTVTRARHQTRKKIQVSLPFRVEPIVCWQPPHPLYSWYLFPCSPSMHSPIQYLFLVHVSTIYTWWGRIETPGTCAFNIHSIYLSIYLSTVARFSTILLVWDEKELEGNVGGLLLICHRHTLILRRTSN